MYYSRGLEYIIGSSYSHNSYANLNYFAKNTDDNYGFERENEVIFERAYRRKEQTSQYHKTEQYKPAVYTTSHSFTPEVFLKPSRPKARFVDDNDEVRSIAAEIFESMMKEKMPENISINVLSFDEFKALHSRFGFWSNGVLGFSINGDDKKIFVRENHLDSLMLVIGHEIGHVLTETLPNKHDEEAKAFAFSVEWARTIKQHNVANLGSSIKDEVDFQPARNGLHDVAFAFVDFMVKNGRKAIELHDDFARKYISVFDRIY